MMPVDHFAVVTAAWVLFASYFVGPLGTGRESRLEEPLSGL